MLEFERLPEWQRAVKSASVLSRDSDGRAHEVAYEIDVHVGIVRYTLRHTYEVPSRIGSVYVEGDFRDCEGEWTFDDLGDGTTEAGFRLRIDPGRIIPRPVVRMLNRRVMKGSVDDLRRYYAERAVIGGLGAS
jgi:ribosome-associated toxin RatA of RatAB toxin-antitoxin module